MAYTRKQIESKIEKYKYDLALAEERKNSLELDLIFEKDETAKKDLIARLGYRKSEIHGLLGKLEEATIALNNLPPPAKKWFFF